MTIEELRHYLQKLALKREQTARESRSYERRLRAAEAARVYRTVADKVLEVSE